MNVTVQYKCDDFRAQIEKDIARYSAKLERWLSRYDSDGLDLHASFDKHARKRVYLVNLNLNFPHATLHASAGNAEARFAVRRAFDELETQVKKQQSLLRHDYEWKRKRLRNPVSAEA